MSSSVSGNQSWYADRVGSTASTTGTTATSGATISRSQRYYQDSVGQDTTGLTRSYTSTASEPQIPIPMEELPNGEVINQHPTQANQSAAHQQRTTRGHVASDMRHEDLVLEHENVARSGAASDTDQFRNWREQAEEKALHAQNLTQEQVRLLRFYLRNPSAQPQDATLRAALANVKNQADKFLREDHPEIPEDYAPDYESEEHQFQMSYVHSVQRAIGRVATSLTEQAALELAYYHPETVTDPSVLTKLAQVHEFVDSILATTDDVAVPNDWRPNMDFIDGDISAHYDLAFESALRQWGIDQDQDASVVAQLRTLHYFPDSDIPPNATAVQRQSMKTILGQIEQQARTEAQGELTPAYGSAIPATLLSADSGAYNSEIQAYFHARVSLGINALPSSVTPPTPEQMQAALTKYLANPDDPTIPDNIKQILSTAISQTISTYQLPGAWKPEATAAVWQGPPVTLNALQYLDQMKDAINNQMRALRGGPADVDAAKFMLLVHQALTQLQELLYASERSTTVIGLDEHGQPIMSLQAIALSNARLETQKQKIAEWKKSFDEQVAEQQRIADKAKKSGLIGFIMKIVSPIVIAVAAVATIATCGAMAPVAAVLTIAFLSFQITSAAGGPDLLNQMMLGVGEGFSDLCTAMGIGGSWAKYMGEALLILIITTMCMYNPEGAVEGAALAAGCITVGADLLVASNATTEILIEAGVDPMTAMIVGAALNAVIGASGAIAGIACTAKRAEAIANMAAQIDKLATSIARETSRVLWAVKVVLYGIKKFSMFVLQNMDKIVKLGSMFMSGITSGLTAWNAHLEASILEIQGEVAEKKGKAKGLDELLRELIKGLQDAIESMQRVMSGIVEQIDEVSKTKSHVTQAMRAATQGLYQG